MKQSTITKVAAVVVAVLTLATLVAAVLSWNAGRAQMSAIEHRTQSASAAEDIRASSGHLTNTVRAFAATGDRQWLDQYWTEINETKRQAKALDLLRSLGTPQEELDLIAQASANSGSLVRAETGHSD